MIGKWTKKIFLLTFVTNLYLHGSDSNIQIVQMQKTPANENAQIRLSSENILDPDHPLLATVVNFPIGVNVDVDQYAGFRNNSNGSSILLYFNGAETTSITFDDKVPLIEERTYFKSKYRKKLPSDFFDKIPKGVVVVTAIAMNSWGESVKQPGAVDIVYINVMEKGKLDPEMEKKMHGPYLLYNQPTGTFYVGQPILLDFYLFNVSLSSIGYKVDVYIDGKKEESLVDWRPYAIQGLGVGVHEIELRLVDRAGNKVQGPYRDQKELIRIVNKS